MNVAITRAKYFLLVIGNSNTLKREPMWKGLVEYCQS